jgi:hypothetical protein
LLRQIVVVLREPNALIAERSATLETASDSFLVEWGAVEIAPAAKKESDIIGVKRGATSN